MLEGKTHELSSGKAAFFKYGELSRYILAKEITFDLLITIYNVNTMECVALRAMLPFEKGDIAKLKTLLSKFTKPNLEVRAIGLQNGAKESAVNIGEVMSACKASLIELDLFGSAKRNIAIDMKTGMSYDVLLLDRIYKPGELANDVAQKDYLARASKLDFVKV